MEATKSRWVGRRGGCVCGALRYEISGEPMVLVACHCTDCQRRSGGPLTLSLPLKEADVQLLQGTPVQQQEQVEERVKTSDFCGTCHARLFVRNTAMPGVVVVKAGTLDERDDLRPAAHLWVRSKQPWVALDPEALSYPMQPSLEEFATIVRAWTTAQQA